MEITNLPSVVDSLGKELRTTMLNSIVQPPILGAQSITRDFLATRRFSTTLQSIVRRRNLGYPLTEKRDDVDVNRTLTSGRLVGPLFADAFILPNPELETAGTFCQSFLGGSGSDTVAAVWKYV
jgi:hypothetical protein